MEHEWLKHLWPDLQPAFRALRRMRCVLGVYPGPPPYVVVDPEGAVRDGVIFDVTWAQPISADGVLVHR